MMSNRAGGGVAFVLAVLATVPVWSQTRPITDAAGAWKPWKPFAAAAGARQEPAAALRAWLR